MQKPSLTVVIPAYNLAPYIGACLDSVIAQSFRDWECIVVDDGSTDGTADIVSQFRDSRVRLVRLQNGGVSRARNAGLAAARGAVVMFLDGDDLLHPSALERLQAGLIAMPAAVASFGTFVKVYEDGSRYPQKPLHLHRYPDGDVLAPMIRENFLANGGHVLLKTEVARRIGGFNETLRLSEDWEFWCRLAAEGPFRFIGTVPEVFYLRMRTGSSSRSLARDWSNHEASVNAVLRNSVLQSRFRRTEWTKLERQVRASHLWEAGRVNFVARDFGRARSLMIRSLAFDPKPKRLALFAIAQVSQLLNRSLVARLRFNDEDARPTT